MKGNNMAQSIAFDRAADYYDDTRGFPPGEETRVADAICRAGSLTSDSRVLEIGIGTGRIALPLAGRVQAVYGVDLSLPMMQRLRAKQDSEPVYVAQGDATRLPLAAAQFDAVVSVHVFHLIPDWQSALHEVGRVLKSGGNLIHCWSVPDNVHQVLWEAWRSALPNQEGHEVGMRFEQSPTALHEMGWKAQGDPITHAYHTTTTPRQFAERLQNRIWSQTWRLTDAQLAQAVGAVWETIREHYETPDDVLHASTAYFAQAYQPPAS